MADIRLRDLVVLPVQLQLLFEPRTLEHVEARERVAIWKSLPDRQKLRRGNHRRQRFVLDGLCDVRRERQDI